MRASRTHWRRACSYRQPCIAQNRKRLAYMIARSSSSAAPGASQHYYIVARIAACLIKPFPFLSAYVACICKHGNGRGGGVGWATRRGAAQSNERGERD